MTDPIPQSLKNLESHQAAYLRRLQQMPYFSMMQPVVERFLQLIISQGAFYLRVHQSSLESILESGCIRSLAETGSGTTTGGVDVRRKAVEALFGCKTFKMHADEYPKYGFLSQPDAHRDLWVNGGMWSQYGDVSIQLKKERLLHRTTLTVGNSVNFGRCYTLVPTRVDWVLATCICGLPHDGTPMMTLQDPCMCYALFTTWILEHKLTVQNFPMIDDLVKDAPPVFEYFELQYHGPLSLAQDVERIDVIPSDEEEHRQLLSLQSRFEAIGVPFHVWGQEG